MDGKHHVPPIENTAYGLRIEAALHRAFVVHRALAIPVRARPLILGAHEQEGTFPLVFHAVFDICIDTIILIWTEAHPVEIAATALFNRAGQARIIGHECLPLLTGMVRHKPSHCRFTLTCGRKMAGRFSFAAGSSR